ncbi:LCP family protein [Staphylococcus debuckii]|uniref:LCP family protein n=1 Tax=Staphylococcus debuckii TaxID=2044912 RepID=UPI000F4351FF|nr:LCP family protein [Staphylococcus debuckii]AYU54828.1 LytR family transcriptional regulator [Staphylococcus debuckii]
MNKVFKYFLILLSLVLVIIPIVFAVILLRTSQHAIDTSFSGENTDRTSNLRNGKVNPAKDPVSILFLGIDDNKGRRENGQSTEHSRTDAMILSTLNPDKKQVRMLSIPRDTISYIPKVGYYDKITHAHAYGGPVAAMDAVEGTLNVPVDYYVRVDMDAFVQAVDELGGIYYDVPYNLNEPNTNDDGRTKVKKGYHKLNGDQALAVARTRYHDSDLKRGQRQMELIKILFKKAQKLDSVNKLNNLVEIVGKNSKHDLSNKDIQSLLSTYLPADLKIKTEQLEGNNDMLNGIYYYNPDIKSIKKFSNLLRGDLGLPKIKDNDDFLNQRFIDQYGELVPLTEIDESLLRKNQHDTSKGKNDNDVDQGENQDQNDDQQNQGDPNQQQDPNAQQDPNSQQAPNVQQDPNGYNQDQQQVPDQTQQGNPQTDVNNAQQAPSNQGYY